MRLRNIAPDATPLDLPAALLRVCVPEELLPVGEPADSVAAAAPTEVAAALVDDAYANFDSTPARQSVVPAVTWNGALRADVVNEL